MSNLALRALIAEDLALRARVAVVLSKIALDVLAEEPLAEDAPLPEVMQRSKRHTLATRVLQDPAGAPVREAQWAAVCWTSSTLADSYVANGANGPTDSDLEWTLLAVWDALAGV